MIAVIVLTILLCFVFWGCCYISTGGDEKNIKALATYPDEIQEYIRNNPKLRKQVEKENLLVSSNPVKTFLANAIIFLVVLFLLGIGVRTNSFFTNFLRLSVMGQGLNLFDYVVIDLFWWRNTKRIRFTGTENNSELYRNPRKHTISFVKGIAMFLIIAFMDGILLTLF